MSAVVDVDDEQPSSSTSATPTPPFCFAVPLFCFVRVRRVQQRYLSRRRLTKRLSRSLLLSYLCQPGSSLALDRQSSFSPLKLIRWPSWTTGTFDGSRRRAGLAEERHGQQAAAHPLIVAPPRQSAAARVHLESIPIAAPAAPASRPESISTVWPAPVVRDEHEYGKHGRHEPYQWTRPSALSELLPAHAFLSSKLPAHATATACWRPTAACFWESSSGLL